MIVEFIKSIIGDKLASFDSNLIANVFDLFNGNSFNFSVSLIGDAINLGVLNVLTASNCTSSKPWSRNDISLPPALVPLTVLIRAETAVCPGTMKLILG